MITFDDIFFTLSSSETFETLKKNFLSRVSGKIPRKASLEKTTVKFNDVILNDKDKIEKLRYERTPICLNIFFSK
jgi:hypothetical protein